MGTRAARAGLAAIGFLLLLAACGVGSEPLGSPSATDQVWGPVAAYQPLSIDPEVVAGTIEISEGCVTLDERGHRRWNVAWPSDRTSWESPAIVFASDGLSDTIEVRDQDRVTIMGIEFNNEHTVSWVTGSPDDCFGDAILLISDIVEIVATDASGSQKSPIGGGIESGTGSDIPLECPAETPTDTTEWSGPVGLTLTGAVEETFGDLVVGWMGEPFEIESRDNWSSWGLEDSDGNLVAVATLVTNNGGWDPSHARFCVIPRPEPPPAPFTLYVSNQSFDDDPVRITISIGGEVVVDDEFAVEGQHNWVEFTPDIEPGHHTLIATSDTGAEFTVDLELPEGEPRWAVVDYWFYPDQEPRRFTFDISDEPIGFD
jgi:hypothetical protein